MVSHLDLYRSRGVTVEELADLEEYLDEAAIVFVEWPEAGAGVLPPPTVEITIDDLGDGRRSIAIDRAVDRYDSRDAGVGPGYGDRPRHGGAGDATAASLERPDGDARGSAARDVLALSTASWPRPA